jgi:opacity protein-like surface antigen
MKFARTFLFAGLLAATAAASATTASAQVKQLAGGYLVGGLPMGDWGKIAGFGLALDGNDIIKHKANKPMSVRTNMGILYNFSRTVDVPQANMGANDKLDIETKNWSLLFGVGPEFSKPSDSISPFIFGTVGFDTYWTSSTLSGTANGASYSAEHGDSRIAFAWSAGLGLRRMVTSASMVELSAEYRSGTEHHFLLPDDVHVSGGGVTADRASHTSDQILIRLGTVLGN